MAKTRFVAPVPANYGRAVGYLDVIELAPDVCPACGLNDPAAFIKVMKTRIAIRLQDAGEVGEMLLRMLPLTIFRVGEPYRWRCIVSSSAVIAHIGPESRGLRLARRQHGHRRECLVQPSMKLIEWRPSTCLPDFGSDLSRLAAHLAFDVVERADTLDGFGSEFVSVRDEERRTLTLLLGTAVLG